MSLNTVEQSRICRQPVEFTQEEEGIIRAEKVSAKEIEKMEKGNERKCSFSYGPGTYNSFNSLSYRHSMLL